MKEVAPMERYIRSVEYQSKRSRGTLSSGGHRRVITISRQAGSGAHVVAEELVRRLQAQARPGSPPWTVFDRNLVDQALKEHDLPDRLREFMPEDQVSDIADAVDALFGLHPSAWTLVRKTADTILHLAELGNVVLIGRGANIITAKLDYAYHVRLVGSLERRIAHVQEYRDLGARAAAEYVRREDLGRKRYVQKYYGADIDDPLLYHLVINTDRVPYEDAARMIVEAVAGIPGAAERVARGSSTVTASRLG
jgi:cytidylate kinase